MTTTRFRGPVLLLTALGLTVVLLLACSQTSPPVLQPVRDSASRTPVIFVPGVTGVGLIEQRMGKSVWGRGKNLIYPHDRGYRTVVPIVQTEDAPQIVAGEAIRVLRVFGVFRKKLYQHLVELFEANGYRVGDLNSPEREDSFFLFGYDWRKDNVGSARYLADRLEALRQARGEDNLEVVLVCQSNGAHICRYLSKFGDVSLEEAETGVSRLENIRIQKLVLVGSSNGGSLRVLRELDRGRQYLSWYGRTWSQEALFTFESLYQDLPAYSDVLFVDENGEPMEVDLYQAENWQRCGWSAFGAQAQARLSRPEAPEFLGTNDDRLAFLRAALERARRFQAVLKRETPLRDAGLRYYVIKNLSHETSRQAVLVKGDDGWQTWFTGDKELDTRPSLKAQITVIGDGHASEESQMWLSELELARVVRKPRAVGGRHYEAIFETEALEEILVILNDEPGS